MVVSEELSGRFCVFTLTRKCFVVVCLLLFFIGDFLVALNMII